ncbi:N-acetylneuraminate synthase [Pleionea sediminis]|uniref:N-acetylneuraminate synthase n=1 Tax=Pleionea sediminis TaxID=2569479 RepID=UPI0011864017|nr:N-acetylneuraminate synthase [Pleionea sediminis]
MLNPNRVLIIAEAGVNHNGDINLAKKLIDAAAEAGADIVKFQTFRANKLAASSAEQAKYQAANTGVTESQLEMLKRLELKYEDHQELVNYCNSKDITFLSTAFDSDSLRFLTEELGQKLLKVPSGELTNAPLILAHALTGLNIILSTGMATLAEIETALGVIAFGYLNPNEEPSEEKFIQAYFSSKGQRLLREKVTILHCTTEYPAPYGDINLNAMDTIKNAFKLNVGYSDHSQGIVVPVAAAAKRALIIEKHFTLDKTMEGPDHKASLEPHELKDMIAAIRIVEQISGDGVKGPRPSEVKNIDIARKSIVASKNIRKGELFSAENLTIKRPGNGMNPMHFWDLVGTTAERNYNEDELI